MKRILAGPVVLGAVGCLLHAAPALALCAEPPSLPVAYAEADVVFKGVVEDFGNNTALVTVEEVWKGPPLPETVEVITGAVDDDADDDVIVSSSVDRSLKMGNDYLFFPVNAAPPFNDNACTSTRRYASGLERLREPSLTSDPSAPAGRGILPHTGVAMTIWVLAAWVVMLLGAFLVRAGRNRGRPPS